MTHVSPWVFVTENIADSQGQAIDRLHWLFVGLSPLEELPLDFSHRNLMQLIGC
jgi:hypothetical protein